MARTPIDVYDLPGVKDIDGVDVSVTSGDSTNDHSVDFGGGRLIIIAEATGAVTVTVLSVADPIYGRTGNHIASLTNGEKAILGAFSRSGFVQSDGLLHIDVSSDDVSLYAIRI